MSKLVGIVGESGTGKSTSIENLNPENTYIINVAGKDLPFKGSRKKYNKDLKNYKETTSADNIVTVLRAISKQKPEIKYVIIDDFQYIMATEFINRAMEKGYDKWSEMAQNTFKIVSPELHKELRDDLYVVTLTHTEEVQKNYETSKKMKTSGKLIDQHLTLEGLYTIVLFTEVFEDDNKEMQFRFRTITDGKSTAKSPKGMFEDENGNQLPLIPNDLNYVFERMDAYYNE